MVRAKFVLTNVAPRSTPDSGSDLTFNAQYDETIEEDRRYSRYTPSGSLSMHVDNPAALAQFEQGKAYYLDFTPADA